MKLLSLRVEHFRCIEKAKIDFASGLNVLYGPNDLGKSSLALAIRAVLLLQTTAKEHEEFVSWHGTGEPLVELVFESEPQRIWRLRKTFGSSSAYLEWSKDGVDFATEARGRDVDGRLSEILKWGVAPPGGKGRPKGMPPSFLATVLLPEQDGVGAIFDQGLDGDSDKSGKDQLVTALQAMAEDPLFKSVLARVQERVDEAFNSSGGRKRGKNSPWVKWTEEIQRKQEYSEKCHQELQATAAIEAEIQELLARQLISKEGVSSAQESIERLNRDFEKQKQRQAILARVDESKARVAAISKESQELAEAERMHSRHAQQIDALSKLRDKAKAAATQAAIATVSAKEELARLASDDRVRQRQLQKSALETSLAGLRTEKLRQQTSVESIRRVEVAAAKVQKLEVEYRVLVKSAREAQKKFELSCKQREELRRQADQESIAKAEKGIAQVNEWRTQAAARINAAACLEAAQPRFPLPSQEQLNEFRRVDSDMRVAAAKLEVGLSVTLRPKHAMRISVQSDGAGATSLDLTNSTFELAARRQMQIDIAGIAEIAISGGAADARQEANRLDSLWSAEVAPALRAAGAATLEDLTRIASEAAARAAQIESARQEAVQLEQRANDQPDWTGLLASTAFPKPGIVNEDKQQDGELTAANTRAVEKQKVLDEAAADLKSLTAAIGADWQDALKQALQRQAEVGAELTAVERNLAALATAGDESLVAAKRVLTRSQDELSKAEAASQAAEKNFNEANLLHATNSGALQTRRDNVAKLDHAGACAALRQVESELQLAPAPEQPVSDASLAAAHHHQDELSSQLKEIDDKIREKRGALQQVGGDVARQRSEDAANELQSARDRAQEVELEFNAWELLRKTLREAEQEEGTHLGHALAGPITKRFAALTADRYGKLALGPNLETHGVSVAGEDRLVRLLSVGTRDQLSTLFRLTLAEELKTAVILDDQLTQTDALRMSWLRDLLKEVARNIQVIVFTCRLEDYQAPLGARKKPSLDELQPVRSVNLSQLITRHP